MVSLDAFESIRDQMDRSVDYRVHANNAQAILQLIFHFFPY